MKSFKVLRADARSVDKLQEKLKEAEMQKKGETARLEQEVENLKEEKRARVAKLKAEVLTLKRSNEALGMLSFLHLLSLVCICFSSSITTTAC